MGDLNGDGHPDLVTVNDGYNVPGVSVVLSDGHGGFGTRTDSATGPNPQGLVLGDLNGDGKLDIVTVNSDYTNKANLSVLLGDGHGGFGMPANIVTTAAE